jgi:hypothetical protein
MVNLVYVGFQRPRAIDPGDIVEHFAGEPAQE